MHSIQEIIDFRQESNTQLFIRSLIKDLNAANITAKTGILSKRISEILKTGKATNQEEDKIFNLWNATYLNDRFDCSWGELTDYANKHGE
jgi:hypothetical protein